MPPGLEASQQHSSTMDYLLGIVVLLCGAVQQTRGLEPKHNVPRLKLSYKGKPILRLTPGYTEPCWCVAGAFILLRLVQYFIFSCPWVLFSTHSFVIMLSTLFFLYFCKSFPCLIQCLSLLVTTQHTVFLSLPLTPSLLTCICLFLRTALFFFINRLVPYAEEGRLPQVKCIYWLLYCPPFAGTVQPS